MAQKAVVTLPITPRTTPKLGLMFIPFIMDILSKRMGVGRVLGLNVHGLKLVGKDIEEQLVGYMEVVVKLGITPNFIWRDDQKENIYWVNRFFQKLITDGYIFKDRRLIMCCPCRAVETLASAENVSSKKRLYESSTNHQCCRVCGGNITQESNVVYLFRVPRFEMSPNSVFPNFLQKEISNIAKRFAGIELLISRSRSSAISLWTGAEHVFLDVDFGWQLYLPILRRYGYDPVILIGSQENLLGSYLALVLSHLIDAKTPTLVVPAYCRVKRFEDEAILNLFCDWSRNAIRLYLASHMTFRRKETYWDTALVSIATTVANNIQGYGASTLYQNLQEALSSYEGSKVRQQLSRARIGNGNGELLADLVCKEKL